MSLNTIILINLIYLTVLWYILSALFFDHKNKLPSDLKCGEKALEDLQGRKEEALLALKDLELDYKTHKISEGDYLQIKQTALDCGAGLMEQIEILKKTTTPPKSTVETLKFCTHCGTPRLVQANFCGQCGKKLE